MSIPVLHEAHLHETHLHEAQQARSDRQFTSWTSRPVLLLALMAGAGAGAGLFAGSADSASAVAAAGDDLTRLLRAMAALKLLFVAAATAAILWRLRAPIGPAWLAAYAITAAAMAAGPGLVWTMTHVGLGAALMHLGLLGSLVLLWRDPATGQLLAAALARRRAAQLLTPQR